MKFTKEDSLKTKGIAVILLLFHHLFFTDRGYPVQLHLISQDSLRTLAVAARICVWIFCFISAYGITLQFYRKSEEQSIGKFVFSRWLSLMKGYWFVFALTFVSLLIAGKAPMKTYEGSAWNLLLDGFALSDFFQTPTLLGTWWYMCFAQLQLLLLPVLILFFKRVGGVAGFFAIFIGSQFLGSAIVSPSGGDYLMYTYATVFGILCVQYDFFGKVKALTGVKAVGRWLAVLAVTVVCIWLRFVVTASDFAYNARQINRVSYGAAAVGLALLVCLLKSKKEKGTFVGKAMAFLGKHSGNIFLVHMFLVKYFGKIVYGTKNVIVSVAILLVASCLLSLLVEGFKKLVRYNQWFDFSHKSPEKV